MRWSMKRTTAGVDKVEGAGGALACGNGSKLGIHACRSGGVVVDINLSRQNRSAAIHGRVERTFVRESKHLKTCA